MKAEIIAVGTELLLGQVVNTNATFLAEELTSLGFDIYHQVVVGDNPSRLEKQLELASQRSDLVVLCGGLGPTPDDLTRDVVAKFLGEELVIDPVGYERLEEFFSDRGGEVTQNNRRQALTISGGQGIQNPTGLAVGTLYQGPTTSYLLVPGPPRELYPMFHEHARPLLKKMLPQSERLTSRVLRFFGIGESKIVVELADLIENQTNPTLASYAKPAEVTLRLTAKAADTEAGNYLLDELEATIMARVGEYFYGYGEENSLVAETVKLLKEQEVSLTCAESLTAGLVQSTLGSVPGVSAVFPGGFVTYSPTAKATLLDIDSDKLAEEGTVSEFCAREMAEGAREKMGTDYALALTGVAGPDKSEGKEVGTVCLALARKDGETITKAHHLKRDRDYIRHSSMMLAFDLLRRELIKQTKGNKHSLKA